MKKLMFSLLAVMVIFASAQAQEDPAKALKKAGTAFKTYQLDPAANTAKLQEAVDMINIATAAESTAALGDTWQVCGDIYNEIANKVVSVRQFGIGSLDDLPKADNPALTAYNAYEKALGLALKKFQSKDALKGIRAVQNNLNNMGIYTYEEGNFANAYENFNGVLKAHELLKAGAEESMLETDEAVNDQLYITGLAALNAEKIDMAAPLFMRLKESGADKPAIYEALYKIEAADAMSSTSTLTEAQKVASFDKAYANLETGRTRFPDDVSLLFAEINHFLRVNKLDQLITKLESAIQKEPDNISLYTTMGNVYDNLYQREAKEGSAEKAQTYFDKSLEYYGQALKKDPNFTDATYSIGALYFNRAANMTQELQKLADDYSKAGQAKYEALQAKVKGEFETALPYFMDVEKKNPNDVNTLIALKEIYARKSDYTMSNEFKARLEKVQAGETLESYFMKN